MERATEETAILVKSFESSVHETPASIVFHTPPPTAAAYHVLPVASVSSTAIDLVLPGTLVGPLSVKTALSSA